MDGSFSAPKELPRIMHDYGGDIAPIWGVPVEKIQAGIRLGARKVNVDTDLRMVLAGAIRATFANTPSKRDPRKFLAPGKAALAAVCRERFVQFGRAGRGGHITPIALAEKAHRYVQAKTAFKAVA